MDPTEEGKSSWSAMDGAQQARCKEMLGQILAMATEMASDLKAFSVDLKACNLAFRTAPLAIVDDFDDAATDTGYNSVCSNADLSEPIPSPTLAPLHDADLVSTDGELCILFNTDDRDVDRLSRLPNSLLRDIVARLPIKDAGRTAVLSRRWSHIWRTAPLVVSHADLAVFRLDSDHFYSLDSRSPDRLLEQIRLQQEGHARPLLANHEPSAYTAARAWRPPWFCASCSTPTWRCCPPSREPALMPTPVVALEFLIRPYDLGAGFACGARVGVYFDAEEAELAHVNASAMDLLRRSGRTWPADLRTGVGTMLDSVGRAHPQQAAYHLPGAASHPPWDELAARPHALGDCLVLASTTSNLVTFTSALSTSSPISTPSQEKTRGFQFGTTELLISSPTRCSMHCCSGFTSVLTTALSSSTATWVSTMVVRSFEHRYITTDINPVHSIGVSLPGLTIDARELPMVFGRSCDVNVLNLWLLFSLDWVQQQPWPSSFSGFAALMLLKLSLSVVAQSQLTPWPPPSKGHGKGMKSELLAVFLSKLGCSQSLLNLMSLRSLSQSKLMPFQFYASCVLGCGFSKFLDRQNVQVQQQWKFSDDALTSNLKSQRVILWAGGDLCAIGTNEFISEKTISFCGCYSTDTSNTIVAFVAWDILQTTNMLQSHLLDMFRAFSSPPNTSNVRPQQGSKLSKPPWFQFIDFAISCSELRRQ